MALDPHTRLGPYEIIAPLGAGGMGEVYRARDARLDRDVAIKVLPERTAGDERALSRFRRETKALAALSHSNILMILDVGEDQGISYAVMELLEGDTLRRRVQKSGLDWRRALDIAAAVADGLAAAHSRDIVHRDLKPENLFLTKDGVVKILDFGLARTDMPGAADPTAPTIDARTQPGMVLGTVNYMSPEQVLGERADARSDIFSLGCVLHEMLTGAPPFARETSPETMTAILRHHPPLPSERNIQVPSEVDSLVARCLEKNPNDRFHSAHDLAFALRGLLARASRSIGSRPVRLPGWAFGSLISLAVLALVWWVASHRDTPNRTAIDSIAVLPFVNASGDPEEEYFVDGMTEALIADLAKIRALKVISRTSAMQFKGAKKPLPEIARALNVEAVVEGSVLRAGGRVRITAELIHAPTDEHLWAESYDRELRDVLRLQSEVAQAIAEQIKVTLTPQEQARMAEARPVNPAAHEAYLKGRFYWNKRTPHDLQKAVEYFERAIDLDPAWPLAYAGLADAYALLPYYAVSKPSEAIPKARAAASTALQLDDSLGEAHASVGQIATYYDWDWPLAEREFQRALSLSPNYATAHHWYAAHLRTMGRDDEAIKQVNKAQELDPLSLSITSAVGWMHYFAGDFAEAEVWLRKALELGPDFATAHGMLARTLFFQRKFVEATAEAREAVRLSHNDPVELTIIGYLSAQAGQTEEARRILDELTARSKEAYVPPTRLALVHAGLEERDRMFECLETANRERDVWLPITLTDPLLAEYRSDPRFVDLVRSMGLPMPKAIPSATAQPTPLPGASSRPPPLPSGDKGGLTDSKIMLVVLPFDNLSGDPEQEYFNDSMTEELISQLGHINPDRLEVIARTSAMPYKKRGKSVEQIGRELNVDYVVEGSVRRADDRIRINAQLVHVGRQTRVWGESFNRELRDILVLQSDVAVAIARQINVKLNPQEESRLAATRAVNPAAYEAYMRGRFQWHNRTRDGMHNAIEHFEHAIDLDPEYAGAYAGLADVHSHLGRHGFVSPKDAFLSAQQAALKAVELDPGSAEAHGALAVIALYFEWDWAVAERGLLRALQLNPSFEEGHHQYSHLLHTLGKPEGSLTESRRALELNPLDPLLNMHLGWHYMMARQYNEAVAQLRSVLDVDPEHYHTLRHIGWAYLYSSRHAEAIAAFEAARKVEPDEPDNPQVTAALAAAHAAGGRGADARALLKQLEDSSRHRYVSACDIAAVYAALRELDTSLEWLEKALDERSPRMMELGLDPVFDPLRTDPRFVDLLRRVGLPQPP